MTVARHRLVLAFIVTAVVNALSSTASPLLAGERVRWRQARNIVDRAGARCLHGRGLLEDQFAGWAARLLPLQEPLATGRRADDGGSFSAFLDGPQRRPLGKRQVIYLCSIGDFDSQRKERFRVLKQFIQLYSGLAVVVLPPADVGALPARAWRRKQGQTHRQLVTNYVFDCLLRPRLPREGAMIFAFTGDDLWAGPGWNYVRAQSRQQQRVAVWSSYRYDLDEVEGLRSAVTTIAHEMGQVFGLQPCRQYRCAMNDRASHRAVDPRPMQLCVDCLAKLWWLTGVEPQQRFLALARWCNEQRLVADGRRYTSLAEALGK